MCCCFSFLGLLSYSVKEISSLCPGTELRQPEILNNGREDKDYPCKGLLCFLVFLIS